MNHRDYHHESRHLLRNANASSLTQVYEPEKLNENRTSQLFSHQKMIIKIVYRKGVVTLTVR
jgi:hypothetical protein